MLMVFVVSDGTGRTADQLVRAALVQFDNAPHKIVRRPNVRTPEQVRALVVEAAGGNSVILHTVVSDELRELMLAECRLHDVDSMDMLGPLLDRFAARLGIEPQRRPGLFRGSDDFRTRQIDAVAFAFQHDDGQHVEGIGNAEIVLVGVSRAMKTPTMLYLAYRGWFAANVPLVPELPLPPELLACPPRNVFCLTATPGHLQALRHVRAKQENIPVEFYATPERVAADLQYANALSRQYGWQQIDVTGKSVEEVCREILAIYNAQHRPEGGAGLPSRI